MLFECLEVFKKIKEKQGDRLILDNYIPDEGTYLLYKITKNEFQKMTSISIKFNKKEQTMEGIEDIYYRDILFYDYYSQILGTNKALGIGKKILSNNYMSFFVKAEKLLNGEVTLEIIDAYYNHLKNPLSKYGNKKESRNLYLDIENMIGKPNEELIERISLWIKQNLINETKNIISRKYIKIFFQLEDQEETTNIYLNEDKRYIIPNIYNNNIYNQKINEIVYGLPNYNMGMNDKKPYLDNKNRKLSMPIMLEMKTALLQKELFDYLLICGMKGKKYIYFVLDQPQIIACQYSDKIPVMKNAIFIRIERETTGLKIKDCEYIGNYHQDIHRPFRFKNIMNLPINTDDRIFQLYNGSYQKKYEIEDIFNRVCFHNYLKTNYDNEDLKITTMYTGFSDILIKVRKQLFRWFYLSDKVDLSNFIYNDLQYMIRKEREIGHIYSAKHLLNLRVSLTDYFNENRKEEERMFNVYNQVDNYLSKDNHLWEFENDDEYYFTVGQVANFLISKSKSKVINYGLTNPILSVKTDKRLKEELITLIKRYGYDERFTSNSRFTQMNRAINAYTPKTAINESMLLCGMLYDCLIYKKDNKGEVKNG